MKLLCEINLGDIYFGTPCGCEDNLIKLDTYTNLSMLNPSLNSDSTFCSQGVPKSPHILKIMKK